jgi:NADPH-dependent 7-cyano-7-deazaguanine reductase QueF
MGQWHREHPELTEQGIGPEDIYTDYYDLAEPEPCRVCGEYLTKGGMTCRRCRANIDEDIERRERGG